MTASSRAEPGLPRPPSSTDLRGSPNDLVVEIDTRAVHVQTGTTRVDVPISPGKQTEVVIGPNSSARITRKKKKKKAPDGGAVYSALPLTEESEVPLEEEGEGQTPGSHEPSTDPAVTINSAAAAAGARLAYPRHDYYEEVKLDDEPAPPPHPPEEKRTSLVRRVVGASMLVISAVPTAINAYCGPMGIQAKDLSLDVLNTIRRTDPTGFWLSFPTGASSLGVNALMNGIYLPEALDKLGEAFTNIQEGGIDPETGYRRRPQEFLTLFLGSSAATAAAAIAYWSFLWTDPYAVGSDIVGLLNFGIAGATRYVSAKRVMKRFIDRNNDGVQIRQEILAALRRTKKQNARLIGDLANTLKNAQSPEETQRIFEDFFQQHFDNIPEESHWEKAGVVFDYALTISVTVCGFLTFAEKGYDGINILAKLLSASGEGLDSLPGIYKVLIGLFPGLASASFYGERALDVRTTCSDIYYDADLSASEKMLALLSTIPIGLSAYSMKNIAEGVAQMPEDISDLHDLSATGKLIFADTTGVGALCVNGNSVLSKFPTAEQTIAKKLSSLGQSALRAVSIFSQFGRAQAQPNVLAQPASAYAAPASRGSR